MRPGAWKTLSPLEAVRRSLASGPGWFREPSPSFSIVFEARHPPHGGCDSREPRSTTSPMRGTPGPPLLFLSGLRSVSRSRIGASALLEMGRTLGPAGRDPSKLLETSSDLPLLRTGPAAVAFVFRCSSREHGSVIQPDRISQTFCQNFSPGAPCSRRMERQDGRRLGANSRAGQATAWQTVRTLRR